mgnify:CR=1 FL=1
MAVHETIFFKAFQFTPLREGRQIVSAFSQSCLSFQFTPLREGRPCRTRHPRLVSISIHAPPRGATDRPCRLAHALLFQFTPLREGRHNALRLARALDTFQFTPLREGRRRAVREVGHLEAISIHAPPRGATMVAGDFADMVTISIHAPPRGATRQYIAILAECAFQFTPLREGRPFTPTRCATLSRISIHAPPRGATTDITTVQASYLKFQFTPLREGRLNRESEKGFGKAFQFTPLREGRLAEWQYVLPVWHFNSRPSARGDSKRYAISANLLFNPYKSAWLNNNATQFVEIILVIFHRIIA